MIAYRTTNRGLVKQIVLVLVILVILAYFGLNIRSIVASPTFQDNWSYLKGIVLIIWNNFLSPVIGFLLKLIGTARNGQ